MQIRALIPKDLPDVLSLLAVLGYPTTPAGLKHRLKRFLKTPGYGAVVYEEEDAVVGLIAWSKSYPFVWDKVRFRIEALVVHQQVRHQGIGTKLLAYVEEIAQQHSPAIIDLTTSIIHAHEGTPDFYQNLGYNNAGNTKSLYLKKIWE